MKQLGIIIVTYKSERHVEPLLRSLAETTDPATCEIWIWDNASPDATIEAVERESKALGLAIHFIAHQENLGFMRANNQVYSRLLAETPCENIVLLNPDTVVHSGWWQPLVAELDQPNVGTVASLLLLPDGTINSCGNALHFLGLGFVQGYGATVADLSVHPRLFFGSGAALAFRPPVLAEINSRLGLSGIFWEELFLYADDTDLGWRVRMVGLENRLVTASCVTHDHRFWLQPLDGSGNRLFYIERNRYLLMLANYHAATILVLLPWIAASEIALGLGLWKLYPNRLQIWDAVWKEARLRAFRQRRARIQAGRTVGDHAILQTMTGSVRHGAIPYRGLSRWIDAGLRISHRLLVFLIRW